MITDDDVQESLDWLQDKAGEIGRAKGRSYLLQEGRKTKKAVLMGKCNETAHNAKETYAYAHPEYQAYIKQTGDAVATYEELKILQASHEARLEMYRTYSANQRILGNFQ